MIRAFGLSGDELALPAAQTKDVCYATTDVVDCRKLRLALFRLWRAERLLDRLSFHSWRMLLLWNDELLEDNFCGLRKTDLLSFNCGRLKFLLTEFPVQDFEWIGNFQRWLAEKNPGECRLEMGSTDGAVAAFKALKKISCGSRTRSSNHNQEDADDDPAQKPRDVGDQLQIRHDRGKEAVVCETEEQPSADHQDGSAEQRTSDDSSASSTGGAVAEVSATATDGVGAAESDVASGVAARPPPPPASSKGQAASAPPPSSSAPSQELDWKYLRDEASLVVTQAKFRQMPRDEVLKVVPWLSQNSCLETLHFEKCDLQGGDAGKLAQACFAVNCSLEQEFDLSDVLAAVPQQGPGEAACSSSSSSAPSTFDVVEEKRPPTSASGASVDLDRVRTGRLQQQRLDPAQIVPRLRDALKTLGLRTSAVEVESEVDQASSALAGVSSVDDLTSLADVESDITTSSATPAAPIASSRTSTTPTVSSSSSRTPTDKEKGTTHHQTSAASASSNSTKRSVSSTTSPPSKKDKSSRPTAAVNKATTTGNKSCSKVLEDHAGQKDKPQVLEKTTCGAVQVSLNVKEVDLFGDIETSTSAGSEPATSSDSQHTGGSTSTGAASTSSTTKDEGILSTEIRQILRAPRPAQLQLHHLSLAHNPLLSRDLNAFKLLIEGIKANISLLSLDLRSCGIQSTSFTTASDPASLRNGDSCAQLAELLKTNHSLQLLDLSNNELWCAGVVTLTKGLEQNRGLTELRLNCNEIADLGCRVLFERVFCPKQVVVTGERSSSSTTTGTAAASCFSSSTSSSPFRNNSSRFAVPPLPQSGGATSSVSITSPAASSSLSGAGGVAAGSAFAANRTIAPAGWTSLGGGSTSSATSTTSSAQNKPGGGFSTATENYLQQQRLFVETVHFAHPRLRRLELRHNNISDAFPIGEALSKQWLARKTNSLKSFRAGSAWDDFDFVEDVGAFASKMTSSPSRGSASRRMTVGTPNRTSRQHAASPLLQASSEDRAICTTPGAGENKSDLADGSSWSNRRPKSRSSSSNSDSSSRGGLLQGRGLSTAAATSQSFFSPSADGHSKTAERDGQEVDSTKTSAAGGWRPHASSASTTSSDIRQRKFRWKAKTTGQSCEDFLLGLSHSPASVLEHLDLEGNAIEALPETFFDHHLFGLVSLNLAKNLLEPYTLNALGKCFMEMMTDPTRTEVLQTLDLTNCHQSSFPDPVLTVLCQSLQRDRGLHTLILSGNFVTPQNIPQNYCSGPAKADDESSDGSGAGCDVGDWLEFDDELDRHVLNSLTQRRLRTIRPDGRVLFEPHRQIPERTQLMSGALMSGGGGTTSTSASKLTSSSSSLFNSNYGGSAVSAGRATSSSPHKRGSPGGGGSTASTSLLSPLVAAGANQTKWQPSRAVGGMMDHHHQSPATTRPVMDYTGPRATVFALREALIYSRTLRILELRSCRLRSRDVAIVCAGLRVNPFITTVDLAYNKFGRHGAQAVAGVMEKSQKALVKLDLSGNTKMGSKGLQAISDAMRNKNKFLEVLLLSDCNLGNAGAELLGRVLQVNEKLRELYLAGNEISAVPVLADALRYNNISLKKLDLSRNQLKCEGIRDLAGALGGVGKDFFNTSSPGKGGGAARTKGVSKSSGSRGTLVGPRDESSVVGTAVAGESKKLVQHDHAAASFQPDAPSPAAAEDVVNDVAAAPPQTSDVPTTSSDVAAGEDATGSSTLGVSTQLQHPSEQANMAPPGPSEEVVEQPQEPTGNAGTTGTTSAEVGEMKMLTGKDLFVSPPDDQDQNDINIISENEATFEMDQEFLPEVPLSSGDCLWVEAAPCCRVTHLWLGKNGIRDDGASVLAQCLSSDFVQSVSLEVLGLSDNNIANDGAVAFASRLEHAKGLRTLDLSGNEYFGPEVIHDLTNHELQCRVIL
ncbi:unnamed protein product [Amoebophrya sp. A120]|nr:unnamed protein product [Amoebophrya sp. A120]|eukprot:GSA120T00001379001.1